LQTKFADLAEGILTTQQIHELIDLCRGIEKIPTQPKSRKPPFPT